MAASCSHGRTNMPASVTVTGTDQEPFPRGTVLGDKYRVDGVLGSGGMGVVLSATHLELDAPVAIKVLRAELARNPDLASQLLFEARAVARLRSAHVVRIIDVARLPTGVPYIVMEQLRGKDLASLLAESGALSIPDAVSYLRQACEGLREAHQLGIVHRDLKPENLFLARTPEGDVLKILDFGISKYVGGVGGALRRAPRSTLTRSGTAVGSPFYMAPEQMRAAPDLDARADIWSLGAIFYELLTARCPFEAESPAALCTKVMVDDAPSLRAFSESIPEQLDEILRRCLQKDPSARFQSVAEL
ncbi:MAG: serine/threonine-protein kinase, partial [Polyangiaceae bacterium]